MVLTAASPVIYPSSHSAIILKIFHLPGLRKQFSTSIGSNIWLQKRSTSDNWMGTRRFYLSLLTQDSAGNDIIGCDIIDLRPHLIDHLPETCLSSLHSSS